MFSTTDQYVFFEINNATVTEKAAVVIVKMSSYFKGIKTFIAQAGKSNFCRIKLIPKTNSGSIEAGAGGDVTLSNGLTIPLPPAAIMDAASKAPYTGTVNVSSFWINPTADDINEIMPGDLRGLNENGALKLLTSYGMAAVELTGNAGQLLQIADGKKATLTFPIPPSMLAAAPANIPLWSFNETTGLWEEDGNAVKSGTSYTGAVSHFSFWNCDYPNNYIEFDCTIQNLDGSPFPFALVTVSFASGFGANGSDYTDLSGYTGGAIPGDAQLVLRVFSNINCSTPVYTHNFTTANTHLSLGIIKISASSIDHAHIYGTVTNCTSSPVSDGYVMMHADNRYYRYPLNGNGAFNFAYSFCNGSVPATFFAEDVAAGQQSSSLSYNLHAGDNGIGNLQACGITTEQFINYTQDGVTVNFTSPANFLSQYTYLQFPRAIHISCLSDSAVNVPTRYISFAFTEPGIAAGSTQQLLNLQTLLLQSSTAINVNITEYGPINQFISGNFTGTVTGAPPANTPSNITCNFRVRRWE